MSAEAVSAAHVQDATPSQDDAACDALPNQLAHGSQSEAALRQTAQELRQDADGNSAADCNSADMQRGMQLASRSVRHT